MKAELESNMNLDGKANYSALKQPLIGSFIKEGLKKLDSFDRWMSNELGDVNEPQMQSSSRTYWEAVESNGGVDDSIISSQVLLDTYMLGPSLSQDQLYSIIDFSPNCAYSGSEVKVTTSAWVNDLRNQIDHTKILSTVYRSASALGSRLPFMVSARAKVTAIHG